MQVLIVHCDGEVAGPLVEMVEEHTEHECGFATSDSSALDWARSVPRCSLLITQLRGEGVDGLTLAGTLSEMFAGLQTIFLPDYAASEERLGLARTKVFPEPIDGERLLQTIALAERQRQIGRDLYHPLDVLQMLCLARRSGAVQLVKGADIAVVFLQAGNIVHAECGASREEEALEEIVAWDAVEFAYDQYMRAATETIRLPWEEAINSALARSETRLAGARTEPAVKVGQRRPAHWGIFGWARKAG